MIKETKFIIESGRRLIKVPVIMEIDDRRITFLKSPFSLKDEIKAMQGSRWHGGDPEPRKVWSVANSTRNRFQIEWLEGGNPYEWFERDLQTFEYPRPLRVYQADLTNHLLTYHFQIWAAEMGLGKTLAAMQAIECSGSKEWLWIGPKKTKETIEYEREKWGFGRIFKFLSYEELISYVDAHGPVPFGIVFDEIQRCKNHSSKRSQAAQKMADNIRETHGLKGFALGMSGTPSPKSPVDWWSLAEIIYPGYLREGSVKAFEERLAVFESFDTIDGTFRKRTAWKEIEVERLYERLQGLVVVKHKKDCLDLPDKIYRRIELKPSPSMMRAAKAIADTAPTAVQGMTLLRELSDGFQYREIQDGERTCRQCQEGEITQWMDPDDPERVYRAVEMLKPDVVERLQAVKVVCPECNGTTRVPRMKRVAKMLPCPKEDALVQLLEENQEQGRIVIFAGFQGSVDRVAEICHREGWAVVRCDGRGWHTSLADGSLVTEEALRFWRESPKRVAFVGHPESGGLGLTLTEARMLVFWSNSFKPENRVQGEDRIHRPGMDENLGATIVDLIHLPSDQRVLDIVKDNRRLELMTLGEVKACLAI